LSPESKVKGQPGGTAAGNADHHVFVRGLLLLVENRVTVINIAIDDLRLTGSANAFQTGCENANARGPDHFQY
jgi:hypothetical protein